MMVAAFDPGGAGTAERPAARRAVTIAKPNSVSRNAAMRARSESSPGPRCRDRSATSGSFASLTNCEPARRHAAASASAARVCAIVGAVGVGVVIVGVAFCSGVVFVMLSLRLTGAEPLENVVPSGYGIVSREPHTR